MTEQSAERRRARRRHSLDEHGIVSARVRPGLNVSVINVSADGALVETDHQLRPGTSVELHLKTASRLTTVRSRVLRCAVVRLAPHSVCYRGALGFDRHLPWLADDHGGYSVPDGEIRRGRAVRADATPQLL